MPATDTYKIIVNEDGSATLLGRVCARNGGGSASPIAKEGNLIVQADLSTATLSAFDVTSNDRTTAHYTATLTISSVIYDTLQTSGIWLNIPDGLGGNFLCDVGPTAFPTGARLVRIEVKFTTGAGGVLWGKWTAECAPVQTS